VCFIITGIFGMKLALETFILIKRVIEFTKGIGDLFTGNKKFKAFRYFRMLIGASRQRR